MVEKEKEKVKYTKEEVLAFNKVINTDKKITQRDAFHLKNYMSKFQKLGTAIEDEKFQKFYRKFTNDKKALTSSNVVDPQKRKVVLAKNKYKVISKFQNDVGAFQYIGLFEISLNLGRKTISQEVYGFCRLRYKKTDEQKLIKEASNNALAAFLNSLNIIDGSGKYSDKLTIILIDYYYSTYITYDQTIFELAQQRSTLNP